MGKLIRRTLIGAAALAVLLIVGLAGWWFVAGEAFFYGVLLPNHARLLEGHEIPPRLKAEAMREDLAFLASELPRLHVAFDAAFDLAEFERRVGELGRSAGELDPTRRQLELIGLLASGRVGNGHTGIIPLQRALDWRFYPLGTYLFDDGLFVVLAADKYQAAVGSRVVSIGGVPTGEALTRLTPYVSADNDWSRRDRIPLLLGMAEAMVALDLAASDGNLTLKLDGPGPSTIRVDPVSLTSFAGLSWGRRAQTPVDGVWSPADPRPRARRYILERRGGEGLYLRINLMREEEDESFGDLAVRLDRMAREEPVETFVIDLRSNSGGNNRLPRPLVETISDHPVLDRHGVLFVLVGRRTFSAAGNFTASLERRTRALFVGEPTGFSPNHYGDAREILLPASKLVARVAGRFWQEDLPGVRRAAIEPDLAVPFRAEHHFSDVDPTWDAIRRYQKSAAPAKRSPTEPGALEGRLGTYLLSPHFRARIFERAGRARLAIDAIGPFAVTDLYGGGALLETDIAAVELELLEGGPPVLHWKGTAFPLESVEPDHRLPIERIRAGEIETGVEAFRRAAGTHRLGSEFEFALNAAAYALLEEERTEEAIALFTLGTELFPQSANTWDSLGDGLRRGGRREAAIAAYRQALGLDPLFDHSLRQLEELGVEPADGR